MSTEFDPGPLPHWDLSNLFASLESDEYKLAVDSLKQRMDELDAYQEEHAMRGERAWPDDVDAAAAAIAGFLERMNALLLDGSKVRAFVYSFVTTDSYNNTAKRQASQLEMLSVRMERQFVAFAGWLGELAQNEALWPAVLEANEVVAEHAFYLRDTAEQSQYLMSEAEESLASELSTSGARAWGRLQGTITSQAKAPFEVDGESKELPITVIRNFGSHPDEAVRRRAYETEVAKWEALREPLAACLNGVKGAVNTLDQRRGREDALHSALDDARMDRETLDALLTAMRAALPDLRRYLRAKAGKLGKERLPWWDMDAPVGSSEKRYTYAEVEAFLVDQFGTFAADLAELTERAFAENWIDAEPRDGKRGGAFCMGIPGVEESRILANYDGSLDSMTTLAHELGHAYHNYCQRSVEPLNRNDPMTLAETASIMNQTIVTEAVLKALDDPEEEVVVLEAFLHDATGVIVDIYSRFLFEKAVFERREQSELPADEICELMLECQREAYGDGLDHDHLNAYMWAWKPHYYSAGLSFYNFPYAFGLLFGLGLFALYRQQGQDFVPAYREFLRTSGMGRAAELAERFEIDLRSPAFWMGGVEYIREKVDRYEAL
ncbi:MAG: M3 family oligoendopeptidase [Candidatus Promineifilaceae bacterium]|nr:M3 family oligoendopeptidase [Candidatus Promineifilaceae bacterium]